MGYAILRIEKLKTAGDVRGMLAHVLREAEVPNAIDGATEPVVLAGARTSQEAMATLAQGITLAKAKGGSQGFTKASTPALDILVTTSHEDMQRMSLGEQKDYFNCALEFIIAKFGGMSNILTAVVLRDETTSHMQVLVMPLDRATNRFSASKMLGGPADFKHMHDAFFELCGKPFDLLRGERDSKAKHVSIQQLYTAMSSGAEPPQFVDVPPAPGMVDRLKPGYKIKVQERDEALKKNALSRETIIAQAQVARRIHPRLKGPMADRYREIQRLADLAKCDKEAAVLANEQAGRKLRVADDLNQQICEKLQLMDSRTAAVIVAKFSKSLASEFVANLAKNLGIQLQAGKDIPDQVRRAGLAVTLDEAVALMEKAADGQLLAAAVKRQHQHIG